MVKLERVFIARSDYAPELEAAALRHAARGWCVVPLSPGEKVPPGGSGGYLGASNDPDQIRRWWSDGIENNIGLNLERSGLVALAVDSYKPGCNFDTLRGGEDMPETL